ncbi:MAG: hypothetical protein WCJ64_00975 [Rhodospirillaceae bacterium]
MMSPEETIVKSMTMLEYLGLGSWHDMLETIMLVIGAGITGFVLSEILIYLWEIRLSLSSDFNEFRNTLERRLVLVRKFGERHAKVSKSVEQVDEELQKLVSRQSALTGKLRQIQDMQSRCVRTIGHPTKGNKCYRALVSNSYVKEYVTAGNSHPVYDESWAKAQIIEVWAASNAFALLVLREKYAQTQGFTIDKIEPVGSELEDVR